MALEDSGAAAEGAGGDTAALAPGAPAQRADTDAKGFSGTNVQEASVDEPDKVKTNGKTNDGNRNVPSVLLKPVWITKGNYTLLFKEGFLKRGEVCRGEFRQFC